LLEKGSGLVFPEQKVFDCEGGGNWQGQKLSECRSRQNLSRNVLKLGKEKLSQELSGEKDDQAHPDII